MRSTPKNLLVFGLTFLLTGLPALLVLQQADYAEAEFGLVLRATARLALLIYLGIFVARPIRQLRASTTSRWLLGNRRYVGIAFAAVMAVHLVLLVWLHGWQLKVPGVAIYLLILLMLITSFDAPTRAFGPRRWRALHKSGIYLIGAAFALTVVRALAGHPTDAVHILLAALMLLAAAIRVAAWTLRRA